MEVALRHRGSSTIGGVVGLIIPAALCSVLVLPASATAPVYGYECIREFPHDSTAFTQGLIYLNSFLYEGTGTYGGSSLRKVVLETGQVILRRDLPPQYFGEGVTALADTFYQITWCEYTGFRYVEDGWFRLVDSFPYPWEGWGLTHDGEHLIASDGSARLRFIDPHSYEELYSIEVRDGGQPVYSLNELEYLQNRIYANIWYSNQVAVIRPDDGAVEAWLDLGGLRDSVAYYPHINVMNGIAYDSLTNRLFITGKRWPLVFEIDVPTLHPEDVAGEDRWMVAPAAFRRLPNPVLDRAEIAFALREEGPVTLHILNPEGRILETLLDTRLAAGEHRISWAAGQPAGSYFVRLTCGSSAETKRLVFVR
jgi:glutamine cyclotransferase